MKKTELYKFIDELVEKHRRQRQQNVKHVELANSFCYDFMRKNKLTPRCKNDKIQEIMRGFEHLDCYIDLNEIYKDIHHHIVSYYKRAAELKDQPRSPNPPSQRTLTEIAEPLSRPEQAIENAERILRRGYKDGHYMELNNCAVIMDYLEKNSCEMSSVKFRNACSDMAVLAGMNRKYCDSQSRDSEEYEAEDDHSLRRQSVLSNNEQNKTRWPKASILSPWKMLELKSNRFTAYFQTQTSKQQKLPELFSKQNSTIEAHNRFDYTKMLNCCLTYLRFVLEKQFHHKCAIDKKKQVAQHASTIFCKQVNQNKVKQLAKRLSKFDLIMKTEPNEGNHSIAGSQLSGYHGAMTPMSAMRGDTENSRVGDTVNSRVLEQVKQSRSIGRQSINQEPSEWITAIIAGTPRNKYSTRYSGNSQQLKSNSLLNKSRFSITELALGKQNRPKVDIAQETLGKTTANCELRKRSRFTLDYEQLSGLDLSKFRSAEREQLERKQEESKKIREKFTFTKRKVKESVLKRISQFVNDVQYAERSMHIQSKQCQSQIESIQYKLDSEFEGYIEEKATNDQNSVEGLKKVVSRISATAKG